MVSQRKETYFRFHNICIWEQIMPKTMYGTDFDDFIDASYAAGTSWGDRVDAGAGDDTIILGPGVAFFSGPGDDEVIAPELLHGTYGGALNDGNSSKPSIYDLKNGLVQ